MKFNTQFLSLRNFGLIILVLILLFSFTLYGLHRFASSIGHLYEYQVRGMQETTELRKEFQDIKFRMAAYGAGILPAAGCHGKLKESRKKIQIIWNKYLHEIGTASTSSEFSNFFGAAENNIIKTQKVLDNVENGYRADDTKAIISLLEDEWPDIQSAVIQPLNELQSLHAIAVRDEYVESVAFERLLVIGEAIAFASGIVLVLLSALNMRTLQSVYYDQVQKNISASKMSSLGEMAGGVAHEINNPLAAIKTISAQLQEVINDDPLDKSLVKEMAGHIELTTNRIAKIVQGLRTFSRDGSKDAFCPINVQNLVDETLSFCKERFQSKGTKLIVENIEKDLFIEGRETELSQVLLNLLNNADDAITKSKDKWIKISVLNKQDWIEIHVMDSGVGIPLEVQKKIFQPFFTTKEIGKGTGLGLSISNGIIQGHHGVLKLNSEALNTCFVIQLLKKQKNSNQLSAA